MPDAPDPNDTNPQKPAPAHAASGGDDDAAAKAEAARQKEIDREVKKAIKAREAEIAEQLGGSIEDVKKRQAELTEAEKAKMSDLEKREAELVEKQQAAAKAETDAKITMRNALASAALTEAGMKSSIAERMLGSLGLELDASKEDIAEAVETLKASEPELFDPNRAAPPAPGSIPPGTAKPTQAGPQGGGEPGSALAAMWNSRQTSGTPFTQQQQTAAQ